MSASGKMAKSMAREPSLILKAANIKGHGYRMQDMVKENLDTQMEMFTKASGKTISDTDLARTALKMDVNMKENTDEVSDRAGEASLSKLERRTQAIGKTENCG